MNFKKLKQFLTKDMRMSHVYQPVMIRNLLKNKGTANSEKIAKDFRESYDLSFANGGDQNNNTIPERPICDQMGINLVDGLGDKIQSSSWLLKK